MSVEITLAGKKVIVTGGGNGIGRALCKKLHAQGAQVYALDYVQEPLNSLAKECPGLQTTIVNLEEWDNTRKVLSDIGSVNGLVNCAGINVAENFMNVTQEKYDRVMNVNVKAMLNVSQVVAQGMIDAKSGGSIVNISSVASKTGSTKCLAYNLSKAAVDMLTKSMAVELGQHKIRVNSVNPIFVLTDMFRPYYEAGYADHLINRIPLGRIVEVDEVVNSILFLLSDVSPMVNGTHLFVDGGFGGT